MHCTIIDRSKVESQKRKSNPLVIATIYDWAECIWLLHEYGFEITLHEDDKNRIDLMTETDDISGTSFQYCWNFNFGTRHLENIEDFSKIATGRKIRKFPKKNLGIFDPVERYLRFRAFSSPNYISAAYRKFRTEKCEKCPGCLLYTSQSPRDS